MPTVDDDLAVAQQWWSVLAPQMPSGVAGLWFGMTELVRGSAPTRTMYVAGCPTFDVDDETAEWATDYVWWPDGRYVVLPGLAGMSADGLDGWDAVLDHAAAVIRRLRPQADVDVDGVAVGFDDGDFVLVWPENNEGDLR
jgi:hypothetical protein